MARATRITVDLQSWKEAWLLQWGKLWPGEREVLLGGIPFIYPTIHPCIWQMFIKPVLG